MARQVRQGDVWRPLANHEVDGDEALEDDSPCRVAQAVLQGVEDVGDARLGVGGDEDVLDVFGLGRRILRGTSSAALSWPVRGWQRSAYLDLGGTLDRFLKGAGHDDDGPGGRAGCGQEAGEGAGTLLDSAGWPDEAEARRRARTRQSTMREMQQGQNTKEGVCGGWRDCSRPSPSNCKRYRGTRCCTSTSETKGRRPRTDRGWDCDDGRWVTAVVGQQGQAAQNATYGRMVVCYRGDLGYLSLCERCGEVACTALSASVILVRWTGDRATRRSTDEIAQTDGTLDSCDCPYACGCWSGLSG